MLSMSFLNLRKSKKTETPTPVKKLVLVSASAPALRPVPRESVNFEVLRRPHISERASDFAAKGVYTFKVSPKATKREIRAAVAALYKVAVEKVRTVTIHLKKITVKGRPGVRSGGKKAYVYLKKGEKIELL